MALEPIGAVETLTSRLANFRMLEAAGMCDLLALDSAVTAMRPSSWWAKLATIARNYRVGLISGLPITSAVLSNSKQLFDVNTQDIAKEVDRVVAELDTWNNDVPCGTAYTAFLQGYAGFAELDSSRGPLHLARALRVGDSQLPLGEYLSRCVSRLDGDITLSALESPMSSYEAFQATADYLRNIFNLPTSALDDVKRFAILPACLRVAIDQQPAVS